MNNNPCPICKAARDAKAAGEEDDAKQLVARRQVAVWILDRDDEKTTPSLFTMSWSMDRDIAALCHNKRTGKVLLIDHPDQGYDISFTRTGKGLNTRYIGMAVDRQDSAMMQDEDEQEKIREYIQENPIPDMLNFYDADYLGKVVEGGTDERDEDLDKDEDEEDEPAPKKKKPAVGGKDRAVSKRPAPRRAEPADEEEEVADEDVEEPDDDDTPAPVKKKFHQPASKVKGRRVEPEEDDEEEGEALDEDEEEAPDEDAAEERGDDDEEPAPKKPPSKPERRAGFRSGRR